MSSINDGYDDNSINFIDRYPHAAHLSFHDVLTNPDVLNLGPPITTSTSFTQPVVTNPQQKIQLAESYLNACDWRSLDLLLQDPEVPDKDRYRVFSLMSRGRNVDVFNIFEKKRAAKNDDFDLMLMRGLVNLKLPSANSPTLFNVNNPVEAQRRKVVSHLESILMRIVYSQQSRGIDAAEFLTDCKDIENCPYSLSLLLTVFLQSNEPCKEWLDFSRKAATLNPDSNLLIIKKVSFLILHGFTEEARDVLHSIKRFSYKPKVLSLLDQCSHATFSSDATQQRLLVLLDSSVNIFVPEEYVAKVARSLIKEGERDELVLKVIQYVIYDALYKNPLSETLNLLVGDLKYKFRDKIQKMGCESWQKHYENAADLIFTSQNSFVNYIQVLGPEQSIKMLQRASQHSWYDNALSILQLRLRFGLHDKTVKAPAMDLYSQFRSKGASLFEWVELLTILSSLAIQESNYKEANFYLPLLQKKIIAAKGDKFVSKYSFISNAIEACCMTEKGEYSKALALINENLNKDLRHVTTQQVMFLVTFKMRDYPKAIELYKINNSFDRKSSELFSDEQLHTMFIFSLYNNRSWVDLIDQLLSLDLAHAKESIRSLALKTVISQTHFIFENETSETHKANILLLKSKIIDNSGAFVNEVDDYKCLAFMCDYELGKKNSSLKGLEQLSRKSVIYKPYYESYKKHSLSVQQKKPIVIEAPTADIAKKSSPAITSVPQVVKVNEKPKRAVKVLDDEDSIFQAYILKQISEENKRIAASKNSVPSDVPDFFVRYRHAKQLEEMQRFERTLKSTLLDAPKPASEVVLAGKAYAIAISHPFNEVETFFLNAALQMIPQLVSAVVCDSPVERKMNEIYYNLFKIFETLKRVFPELNKVRNELRHNFRITFDELVSYAQFLLHDNYLEKQLKAFIYIGKNHAMFTLPLFASRSPLNRAGFISQLKVELNHFELWYGKIRGEGDILKADPGLHRTIKGVHQRIGQILRELRDAYGEKFGPAINQIIAKSNFDAHSDEGDIDIFPPNECLDFLNRLPNNLHKLLRSEAPTPPAAAAAAAPKRRK